MVFSSIEFLFFFIIYFILHFLFPISKRNYLVIIGSTIFYAWWRPEDIWIPYFLILVAFFGYKFISKISAGNNRFWALLISLSVLYIPLLIFKYLGFFYNDIIAPFFDLNKLSFDFDIPLGISFITFTLTTFLVDIYKNKFSEKFSLTTFAAYIMYFPQLIAGPILRPNELIPQLQKKSKEKNIKFLFPISIFTIGLVKKVIFADYLALFVDNTFSLEAINSSFLENILAIYSFSVQIYCDFSGYTDMAIGISFLLGIYLPENFLSPYCSSSLTEFWRNWHITLSNFLRDYIYIPLGGNRFGVLSKAKNLFATMLLGGLWHGANWGFLIWGLLHGFGLVFLNFKRKFFDIKIPNWLSILITFHFVSISWIFFRSPTIEKSFNVLNKILIFDISDISQFISENNFTLILLVLFFALHKWDNHKFVKSLTCNLSKHIIYPILVFLWLLVINFGSQSSGSFIYFDF